MGGGCRCSLFFVSLMTAALRSALPGYLTAPMPFASGVLVKFTFFIDTCVLERAL